MLVSLKVDEVPHIKRIIVTVVGGTILVGGVAMFLTPFPAVLVVPAGLAVLGTEYAWARRWLRNARKMANKALSQTQRIFSSGGATEKSRPQPPGTRRERQAALLIASGHARPASSSYDETKGEEHISRRVDLHVPGRPVLPLHRHPLRATPPIARQPSGKPFCVTRRLSASGWKWPRTAWPCSIWKGGCFP